MKPGILVEDQVEEEAQKLFEEEKHLLALQLQHQQRLPSPAPTPPAQIREQANVSVDEHSHSTYADIAQEQEDVRGNQPALQSDGPDIQDVRLDAQTLQATEDDIVGKPTAKVSVKEQEDAEPFPIHDRSDAEHARVGFEQEISREHGGHAEPDGTLPNNYITDTRPNEPADSSSGPRLPVKSIDAHRTLHNVIEDDVLMKGPEQFITGRSSSTKEDQRIAVDDEQEEDQEEEKSNLFRERHSFFVHEEERLYNDREPPASEFTYAEGDEHNEKARSKHLSPEVIELSSSSPVQARSSLSPPLKESGLRYEESDELEIGGYLEDEEDDEEEEEEEEEEEQDAALEQQVYYDDELLEDEYISEEDFEGAEEVEDYGEEESSDAASSDSDVIMMDGPPHQMQQAQLPRERRDTDEMSEQQEPQQSSDDGVDYTENPHDFGFDGSALSRLQSSRDVAKAATESQLTVQTPPQSDTVGYVDRDMDKAKGEARVPATQEQLQDDQSQVGGNEQRHLTTTVSAAQYGFQQLQQAADDQEPHSIPNQTKERAALDKEASKLTAPLVSAQDSPTQPHENFSIHNTPQDEKQITEQINIQLAKQMTKDQDASVQQEMALVGIHDSSNDKAVLVRSVNANTVADSETPSSGEEGELGSEELEEILESEAGDYWSEEDYTSEEADSASEFEELRPGEELEEEEEEEEEEEGDDNDMTYGRQFNEAGGIIERFGSAASESRAIKSSAVEIIDLESDEDEESAVPSDARPDKSLEITAGYPKIPQDQFPKHDITLVKDEVKQEETENVEYSKTQPLTESETSSDKALVRDKLEHWTDEERAMLQTSPVKREIQDTYSEDMALTEAEHPDSRLSLERSPLTSSEAHISPKAYVSLQAKDGFTTFSSEEEEREVSHEHSNRAVTRESTPALPIMAPSPNMPPEAHSGLKDQGKTTTSKLLLQEIPDSAVEYLRTQVPNPMMQQKPVTRSSDPAILDSSAEENHNQVEEDEAMLHVDDSDDEPLQELSLQDLREELENRSQLPTPTTTQVTRLMSESSAIPLDYEAREITSEEIHDETLPTPDLTQKASKTPILPAEESQDLRPQQASNRDITDISTQQELEIRPPTTPAPSRKVSLIEKVKEMRSESAKKRRASLIRDTPSAVNPWFGPRRSSQLVTETDRDDVLGVEEETGRDGDVSSDIERESEPDNEPSLPRAAGGILEVTSGRLPSSSPPPTPMERKNGFRTSLSYFAPLTSLRSHYNSTTSVLALTVASTPVERATSGPKDYHMTLYITDPSSTSPPSVTLARIFRPSKFAFPAATSGDAILLRNFRVVSYRRKLSLLSTESSAWAVFRKGEEPQINGPPVEFGAEERGFARGLWEWWGTVNREGFTDSVPGAKAEKKDSEAPGRRARRTSVLRHELRDGTSYVDPGKADGSESVHELRDGTRWSDSKL